ncbi:MAG: HDOD domain-containing protein [Gammaproteobacteria bacterium]|nr:MAG: HDOD domain-containing protein [Gammaproteobacteria bacterium]
MSSPNNNEARIQSIGNLPPMPVVAQKLFDVMRDDQLNIEMIADCISEDPGLSARIVSAANKACFSGQREVFSVLDASVRMGLNRVQVITTSILIGLRFNPAECDGFDLEQYWRKALSMAFCASKVAKYAPFEAPPESAYLCGLLHNLGLLISTYLFPKEMGLVFQRKDEGAGTLAEIQREHLGFTPGQVGAEVAERWKLPQSIIDVIACDLAADYCGEYPNLIRMIEFCESWIRDEFEVIPCVQQIGEVPEKVLESIARMSIKESDQLDGMVQHIVKAA